MTRPAVSATRRIHALLASLLLISLNFAVAQEETVVDVAASTPDFSTLLNALDAAGLTETLQGTGPYTVFAPTNEAFAKLSDAELSALLADREALSRVLSYHVVPGSFTTADITEGMTGFTTLAGSDLPITSAGVGDAAVTAIDLLASNGVVFAIDTVLTPPTESAETPTEPDATGELYSSRAEASERYELLEIESSSISGSALVAEYSRGRAIVTASLNGLSADGAYPARLATGDCDPFSLQETGETVADLEEISGALGFSTTTLTVPYTTVMGGDYKLFVLAGGETDATVACGEVGQ